MHICNMHIVTKNSCMVFLSLSNFINQFSSAMVCKLLSSENISPAVDELYFSPLKGQESVYFKNTNSKASIATVIRRSTIFHFYFTNYECKPLRWYQKVISHLSLLMQTDQVHGLRPSSWSLEVKANHWALID